MARHRNGFTLIELLVVIACLGILLAIMIPSFAGLMARARTMKCMTNARTIASAALLYAKNNDGYVMRDYDLRPHSSHYHWAARYSTYMGHAQVDADLDRDNAALYQAYTNMPVLQCPSLRSSGGFVLHYVSNSVDFKKYRDKNKYHSGDAGPIRICDLPGSPSSMYHITEANLDNAQISSSTDAFDYYDTWDAKHVPFDGDTKNDNPRTIHADDDRHQGRTPVVFYDGHAEMRFLTPTGFPTTLFNPLHEP